MIHSFCKYLVENEKLRYRPVFSSVRFITNYGFIIADINRNYFRSHKLISLGILQFHTTYLLYHLKTGYDVPKTG